MGKLIAEIQNEIAETKRQFKPKVTIAEGTNVDRETIGFIEKVSNKAKVNIEIANITDKDGKKCQTQRVL